MEGEKRIDLLPTVARIDKRKGKRKTGSKRKKDWSDLPEDVIVLLILPRLTLVDQNRFSLTCKRWRLASADYIQQRKLPWIMEYLFTRRESTVRLLYDPREDMTTSYVVKEERAPAPAPNLFSGATLCGTRFG